MYIRSYFHDLGETSWFEVGPCTDGARCRLIEVGSRELFPRLFLNFDLTTKFIANVAESKLSAFRRLRDIGIFTNKKWLLFVKQDLKRDSSRDSLRSELACYWHDLKHAGCPNRCPFGLIVRIRRAYKPAVCMFWPDAIIVVFSSHFYRHYVFLKR